MPSLKVRDILPSCADTVLKLPIGKDLSSISADSGHSLSSCEVWIGSSQPSDLDAVSARLDELDEAALLKRDGIAVVYIPFAPNERRAPGFDPTSISTWRREVATEESRALLDVAEVRYLA